MKDAPLKLCANISLLFGEYSLCDRFRAALDNGFQAVEIQFPYDTSLSELIEVKRETGLQLPLINVPAGDLMNGGEGLAANPKCRDAFKRAVEQCLSYAEPLGVEKVNVLAGRCYQDTETERYYDQFLHNLDYAADQLQSIGVQATFEAINTFDMPHFLIHSFASMQQVLSDLNHTNVAMQYDLYHMARMGEDLTQQLGSHLPQIGHIQFADTPDRHEPGSGNLNLQPLLQLLRDKGYRHWVGAEYKPSGKTADGLGWRKALDF
ncbi:MAG: TIM barrel protein [Candidatus Pelagadaptatus aseana]|uniref:hydroxypyruvate isomerase family protein n=1 Tax=Candidatus Pelagadaptatus aseana TaxID=3120508 RepID=UPI0039B29976